MMDLDRSITTVRSVEIRWLRAAAGVADHLHFGRAAVALGIAQSQISQQVAALERDLGLRLFDRDSRNVAPTSAGAAFLADARAALERLDAAAERARAAGRGEHGALAIGTVGSALSAPLPRLLRTFRERFPAVTVNFAELTTAQQVDRLRAGTLDVGFLRPPLPDPGARELDLITVVGRVAAGYGVAVVPASVGGRAPLDVTFARLVPAGPPIELAMAVPDRPPSPVAERFIALARDAGPVRL